MSVRAQLMTLSERFAWLHLGGWGVQNGSMRGNRLMSLSGSSTKVQELYSARKVIKDTSVRSPQSQSIIVNDLTGFRHTGAINGSLNFNFPTETLPGVWTPDSSISARFGVRLLPCFRSHSRTFSTLSFTCSPSSIVVNFLKKATRQNHDISELINNFPVCL